MRQSSNGKLQYRTSDRNTLVQREGVNVSCMESTVVGLGAHAILVHSLHESIV